MYTISKYPDGSSYVKLNSHVNMKKDINFKVNTYEDLWHLNQLVDAYHNTFYIKPTILIPNLIDAQADRRFNEDESSGLKLVCSYLNGMNAYFKIFHPHNPEVVEALIDYVEIIDNSEFILKVLNNESLTAQYHLNDLILMSSDAGGFKPLMKLCDKLNWQGETTSASKYRNHGNPLVQVVDRDDYEGKDILIVDDICVYGGTFKGLSKLLKERNCGKLYLAVSHMTVQLLGDDPVTNYFDKVFTTNSKYDNYYANKGNKPFDSGYQPDNLEVIKMF